MASVKRTSIDLQRKFWTAGTTKRKKTRRKKKSRFSTKLHSPLRTKKIERTMRQIVK
ncbi:hypothetical protein E2C01_101956 [Portunus trituberculatus]|uniref:Uncharacterized protein n=1 Tax=Portunus trituberculatus TaxID=210409 RepID=A0A5B7KH43_PORTR|nr:hypothetical protein [Portunus trituberculatus]